MGNGLDNRTIRHIFNLDKFLVSLSVKKQTKYHNDFIIDRLTNSIINTIYGDSFPTEVSLLTKADLKQAQKKIGWLFNWRQELGLPDREVYKLTIVNNPNIIKRNYQSHNKSRSCFYSFN